MLRNDADVCQWPYFELGLPVERLMRFRAFPDWVGPRILSPKSVDYFGTSELSSGRKKKRIFISKTLMVGLTGRVLENFHCMQISLVMSMRFFVGEDWNDAPYKSRFFYF